MNSDSRSERSTLHPDGWVGNQAELKLARRYRVALRWGSPVFWMLFVAYWVVALSTDPLARLPLLLVLIMGLWTALNIFFHRKISKAIGRKWTARLELKERQHPWQQREETANPVDEWLSRETDADDE